VGPTASNVAFISKNRDRVREFLVDFYSDIHASAQSELTKVKVCNEESRNPVYQFGAVALFFSLL
jgi:hypothetical protein